MTLVLMLYSMVPGLRDGILESIDVERLQLLSFNKFRSGRP